MTMNSRSVDPTWTLQELLQAQPETVAVLRQYGVDSCCGATRTLTAAAKAAGVDLQRLLRALTEATTQRVA